MSITLVVRPDTTMSWQQFLSETQHNCIALDGFVNEGPKFDPVGNRVNFNHHEDVDRQIGVDIEAKLMEQENAKR